MNPTIDLRSDVKTLPTDEMRESMRIADVGDNVAGNDPTVNNLESIGAEIVGKEACLFTPSGTMSNLLALVCNAIPGNEVIVEEKSHICVSEGGGMAYLGGLMAHPIEGDRGAISPDDLREAIRPKGLAFSKTGVICLENTHNVYGGLCLSPKNMRDVYEIAQETGIPMHVDGERIFNSAVAQDIDIKELTQYTDSITVGLSKGLCAPAGSLLTGSRELILRAKKTMKMLGGVMRKPGVLAAAGIIGIQEMWKRLDEDHQNARILAEGIKDLPGISINLSSVETNIVNFDITELPLSPDEFVSRSKSHGLLIGYHLFKPTLIRLVIYRDISREDISNAIEIFHNIIRAL